MFYLMTEMTRKPSKTVVVGKRKTYMAFRHL